MITAMIFGLPMEKTGGMPYVTIQVEQAITVGTDFGLEDRQYRVVKADPVTEENQLQYVYTELVPIEDMRVYLTEKGWEDTEVER